MYSCVIFPFNAELFDLQLYLRFGKYSTRSDLIHMYRKTMGLTITIRYQKLVQNCRGAYLFSARCRTANLIAIIRSSYSYNSLGFAAVSCFSPMLWFSAVDILLGKYCLAGLRHRFIGEIYSDINNRKLDQIKSRRDLLEP